MHSIDVAIQTYLVGIRTPAGIKLLFILTSIFNTVPFILIFLCFAVLIYRKRGLLYSALILISAAFTAVLVWVLKHLINIDRPAMALIAETDKSFPSGHAALSTVFFGMLMFIFANRLRGLQKVIFNIVCVFMIIIISFSRLYLGVHWFSDILGGIILGVLVLFVSIKMFKKYDKSFW